MGKYSPTWKFSQTERHGGWAQYHREKKIWKWHYVGNDTEYSKGEYFTRKDCEGDNRV